MHVSKSIYAEKGGVYLEICERSSLVGTLSTFKKRFEDIAGAVCWPNFGRT